MPEIGDKHKVLIVGHGIKIGHRFCLGGYEFEIIPRPKGEGEMNYVWAKIVGITDKPDSRGVIMYFE